MSVFTDSFQVDCIYLNPAKAFDKVNHPLLIAKLKGYGICGALLEWTASYLEGRYLIVKCEGSTSQPFRVLSGVPQGSHLGPLLFCLFINDIKSVLILSFFLMFADDMKIFNRIYKIRDMLNLQSSLVNVEKWCKDNAMQLNVNKCVVVSFKRGQNIITHEYTINNTVLTRVYKIKDLGIIMSPSLSPAEHINHIATRATALIGFILRSTKDFNSPLTLVVLYKSLVRPILEYGSTIWSPHQINHINQLESIQRRFIKLLGCRLRLGYHTTPVSEVESLFDLSPLHLRRQHSDLLMLFKLVNGLVDCPDLLSSIQFHIPTGTRSRSILRRRYQPTYYAYNSGLSRLLRSGSEAASHLDFFNESVPTFRKKVVRLVK